MTKSHRQKFATPVVLLLAGIFFLTSCSDESSSGTTKSLPNGNDACTLLTEDKAAQALGVSDVEVTPDGFQCDFRAVDGFAGANVIRGQAMTQMETDEEVDLDGVSAIRLEGMGETSCGVSVKLSEDDEQQQFSVIGNSDHTDETAKDACAVSDDVAKAVLNGLPG
ncbi:DUF3558 family protein [Prauserella rugosa]|uniref:DUF3558 family protein n=1 Tax=Prauserella rugosa TaxID=43354 RepID=UPI001FEB527D|nr:DUF3558 family protein [Prauserella rugosa]